MKDNNFIMKYLFIVTLPSLLIASCVKRETDVAVNTCTVDFGWTDSSSKHPKDDVYTKLITDLTNIGLPGISMMVEDSSGIWYKSSGYADLKHKTKTQPCHLSKLASVTKLFTAVMIYLLVDEGKLSLDDLISKYLDDEVIDKINNAKQSRIRDLLAHSSGIYDIVFDPDFILYTFNNLDKEKSYERLLRFAYNKKADFEYNTKRSYNQTLNHTLLAMIINKVTGADQSVMLRQRIFNALQMHHAYLRPQEELPWQQVSKGYYDVRKDGILQDLTPLYTGDGKGFTGIYTQVNDLRLFTNALFRNKTLLSEKSLNDMKEIPYFDTTLACAGACRAMQIQVDGRTYTWYGHPGGEVNYAAGAFYCPEKNATITFTLNYGVAFDELGAYTDAYFEFRRKVFYEVSR